MAIFWVCFEAPDFASQVLADRPMVLQHALRDIERFYMGRNRLQHNALLFYPTRVRTTDDVGRLCGICLFFTWLFFSPKEKNVTSKKKGKHAWACAGIASAFAARFPHGISCRNSADLDFSGLVGSFQSGCLKKGPALILPFFVALMSCPMSRCCAV